MGATIIPDIHTTGARQYSTFGGKKYYGEVIHRQKNCIGEKSGGLVTTFRGGGKNIEM